MPRSRTYLDWNASAPLLGVARDAMNAALDVAGNPSSVHAEGRMLRRMVDQARESVAALVGSAPDRVVFTSGATEAAATVLTPRWTMGRGPLRFSHLYVGSTEHACVLHGGSFAPADRTVLPVGRDGVLDPQVLAEALVRHDRSGGLPLVAIQAANNETGVVQPVAQIAEIVREAGGVLVVDAVQAAGRLQVDIAQAFGDVLLLSAHKIGGPKGVGAIVSASDLLAPEPLIRGGGQERGHRAGTENLPAIAGFGAAAAQALQSVGVAAGQARLRDRIESSILRLAPDAVIHGLGAPRLPNTTFFSVPGLKAETMQIAFDLEGVAVSAGSACSSGKVGPSHVLRAMGLGDEASAVRVSVGATTLEADVERFERALSAIIGRRPQAAKAA